MHSLCNIQYHLYIYIYTHAHINNIIQTRFVITVRTDFFVGQCHKSPTGSLSLDVFYNVLSAVYGKLEGGEACRSTDIALVLSPHQEKEAQESHELLGDPIESTWRHAATT